MARAILTTLAREAAYKMMMRRGTLFFIACTTATFGFVPRLKVAAKSRLLAADGGDAPAVEAPEPKAVEAEAPKVAPSPAEDPFDQPKAEAKAAPAAAAADKPKPVPKKAPLKAKEGGDAPAAMKPPAAAGDAPAKKAIPKKAPPPKKEEKHPYYAWANAPEAGYNTKGPSAYYKEKSQYDLGWFGKYDDAKTEAERSEKFLARHDGVGGESYQTRTKERVYAEIAALKEERAARARRARERRGW